MKLQDMKLRMYILFTAVCYLVSLRLRVLRGIKPPLLQRIQDFKYQTLNSDLVVVMSFSMIVSDLKVCIGELQ